MRLDSILSAAAKNGVAITNSADSMHSFILTKDDRQLHFYEQNGYVSYFVKKHPDTDAMIDLFLDSYIHTIHTIRGAMRVLNPTGVLVKKSYKNSQPSQPINVENSEDITVSHNVERGGIEIKFPGKPNDSVISSLKDKGFRWSPFNTVWWKKYNDEDYAWAKETFWKLVEV